jgi:hypothetical protein
MSLDSFLTHFIETNSDNIGLTYRGLLSPAVDARMKAFITWGHI